MATLTVTTRNSLFDMRFIERLFLESPETLFRPGDTLVTYNLGSYLAFVRGFDLVGEVSDRSLYIVGGTVTSIVSEGTFSYNLTNLNLSVSGVRAALAAGLEANDGWAHLPYIFAGDDLLLGAASTDALKGYAGDDSLSGAVGNDTLDGGAGRDTLSGGAGNDQLVDAEGQNYLRGDDGDDSITGGVDFDDANGNMGNDTVSTGAGEDYCVGGKDNDSLSGGADYDLVYGNLGNDTCDGGDGNDIVRGGQDNDVCLGGTGADFVSGDKGDDTMTGGAGADIFHTFGDAGIDRVTDFNLAQGDRVQLDPGTVFTVSQVGADTVINMTGGGQMILVGVTMGALTPGWIFGA